MSDKNYVKSLINEAEIYRKQGLLAQAKEIYQKVLNYINKSKVLSGQSDLIKAVRNKIKGIDESMIELHGAPDMPELSEKEQGLIKELFTFSKDEKTAAIEGALALAKFGQYEPALEAFNKLLKNRKLTLVAAKNILRCHLVLSSPSEAIDQYEQWMYNGTLTEAQLHKVRSFLHGILEKKGIIVNLPTGSNEKSKTLPPGDSDKDVLDISSVGVRVGRGPEKGRMVDLEVTFQSGNIISIVLSENQRALVDTFKIGIEIPDMQFYSPIAILRGKGVVSGKTKIKSGPKQGDYMVDIRVESG